MLSRYQFGVQGAAKLLETNDCSTLAVDLSSHNLVNGHSDFVRSLSCDTGKGFSQATELGKR
jgi:hypothetical protein